MRDRHLPLVKHVYTGMAPATLLQLRTDYWYKYSQYIYIQFKCKHLFGLL